MFSLSCRFSILIIINSFIMSFKKQRRGTRRYSLDDMLYDVGATLFAGRGNGMDVAEETTPATGTSTKNLTNSTTSTLTRASELLAQYTEQSHNKRAHPVTYRLHPAKYIKCDPLLKEMFFPTYNLGQYFNFRSISGVNGLVGTLPNMQVDRPEEVALTGRYRGVAMFKLRHSDPGTAADTSNALACNMTAHGSFSPTNSGSSTIYSTYRVFQNGPKVDTPSGVAPGNGSQVSQNSLQIRYDHPEVSAKNDDILDAKNVALSLNTIESAAALHTQQFISPLVGASNTYNSAGTGPVGTTSYYNGQSNVLYGDNMYHQNLQAAKFRISDGFLLMDIMNAGESCCEIEMVIHSMKKTAKTVTFEDGFQDIFRAVDMYQRGQTDQNAKILYASGDNTGGWQSLYDPDYPLLKVPSSYKKFCPHLNEVHRSIHVLEPGQSKEIKVYLGNLWYSPASKYDVTMDKLEEDKSDYGSIDNKVDNAGSLMVTLGHSGFRALEFGVTANAGTDNTSKVTQLTTVQNTGKYVGVSRCPSQIMCTAKYMEKFYPMSIEAASQGLGPIARPRPSIISDASQRSIALPLGAIVATQVATPSSGSVRSVNAVAKAINDEL